MRGAAAPAPPACQEKILSMRTGSPLTRRIFLKKTRHIYRIGPPRTLFSGMLGMSFLCRAKRGLQSAFAFCGRGAPGRRPGTVAGPQRLQPKPGGSVGGLHGPSAIFVQAGRWVVLSRTKITALKWGCNRPQRVQPQQGSRVPPGDTEGPIGTQGVLPVQ